ncbi:MAG: CPXCG motif-containing cysteine-rich protein [Aquimonas sp.]|nr:CPXCG motif-containing cysteine-rich protein [Aquimonas sp.]
MLSEHSIQCPWCGERFEALVDLSYGDADYTEDCQVCCRPIQLGLRVDDDGEFDGLQVERE